MIRFNALWLSADATSTKRMNGKWRTKVERAWGVDITGHCVIDGSENKALKEIRKEQSRVMTSRLKAHTKRGMDDRK